MARNPHCILFQGIPGWTMKSFFQIANRVREFVPDAEIRVYLSGATPKPTTDDPQVVFAHQEAVAWCESQMVKGPCKLYTRLATHFDFKHTAVWCYPTHLPQPEDAKTIHMAQRHGAIPIINPIGELGTNMIGGIPIWGVPAIDPLVRARYTCEIVRLLLDEAAQESIRTPMMEFCRSEEYRCVQPSLSIDGWMSAAELLWLVTNASQFQSVAEIGCWKGRSTVALARACRGTVYAIDHWQGGKDEPEHIKQAAAEDKVYREFIQNTGNCKNVSTIRSSSTDGAAQVESVDMAFIDAGHGYDDVVADIRAWLPKTRFLICGHDYNWTTVAKAVNDELGQVHNDAGSIWYKWVGEEARANAAD